MSGRPFHLLTAPQRECLRLAARGYTSKQIGERLGKSYYTIDDRFERAVGTLGAADRKEAVRWFAEHEAGIAPDPTRRQQGPPQEPTPERMAPGPAAVAGRADPVMLRPSTTETGARPVGATAVEEVRHAFDAATPPMDAHPAPRRWSDWNELSVGRRLALIPILAIAIIIGIAGLASATETAGRAINFYILR